MSSHDKYPDPDDMFSDTRMTFGEHIEDLRVHLIRAGVGFLVALIASFFISPFVLDFISKPVVRQLDDYWTRFYQQQRKKMAHSFRDVRPISTRLRLPRRELRDFLEAEYPGLKELGAPQPAIDVLPGVEAVLRGLDMDDLVKWNEIAKSSFVEFDNAQISDPGPVVIAMQETLLKFKPPGLTTLSIQEGFMVYFKVSLMTGFVLGSPWIFFQIWSFIAAGLYPHEKKYVNAFLPFSLFLFLGGVALCEFFVMDKAIQALLWFNEWLGLTPDLRLNEWLGFAIFMPLVFGISFQTPLVMFVLQRVGIFTVDTFRNKRRIAIFIMAIFAAIITPTLDPFTMTLLWAPMVLLYELGIYLCVYVPGRPLLDLDVPEPDELVEV